VDKLIKIILFHFFAKGKRKCSGQGKEAKAIVPSDNGSKSTQKDLSIHNDNKGKSEDSPSDPVNLSGLPLDVFAEVCCYLTPGNLLNLPLTC